MTEIKHALEAEALSAPGPAGLLERVKRRSRRRRLRHAGVGAVVMVIALATAAWVAWAPSGPSPAASRLGTGDVDICFEALSGRSWSVTITEHAWGDTVDSRTEEFSPPPPPIEQPIVGTEHTLTVSILSGPLDAGQLSSSRPIEMAGADAVLGFAVGAPVVLFESGIADFVIRLTTPDSGVEPDALADFARSITVHTDPSACAD